MALFKITSIRSVLLTGGVRLEKGMSVEVIDTNNPLLTTRGKENIHKVVKSKYGQHIKQHASSTSFESEKLS